MARPTSKPELLEQAASGFATLNHFVDSFTEEEQQAEFPAGTLNRNIRDVLAHLHHWHILMQGWYEKGMKGQKPDIPAVGYTWKTTPDLNRWINEHYKAVSLEEVRRKLERSHQEMMKLINNHTDEDLFTKKKYKWTGSTSLGAYLISATSSHYDWAFKLIKKAKR